MRRNPAIGPVLEERRAVAGACCGGRPASAVAERTASGNGFAWPRVLLAPSGTLGDVLPFIAVGVALRRLGCTPLLAAMDQYRSETEKAGIAFREVRPGRRELEADGHVDASIARAVARDLRAGAAITAPHMAATFEDLCAAAAGCDVVVGGSMSSVARVVAEAAGLPLVTLVLQPMGFLSFTEPPRLGEVPLLDVVGRYAGSAAVAMLYRAAGLPGRRKLQSIAILRRQLGLPTLHDELREGPRRSERMIAMYPPAFAPLPRDAPSCAVSAGFPLYDSGDGDLAPPLLRFLSAGPPPLVFTLGSFVVHAAGGFYRTAATVARRLGRRAVLLVGNHAVAASAPLGGDDILVLGHASHAALFPHAAGVIHHGGIGTAAQALAAGLPQFVCPFFGDQFDNAAHLRRLGVADALPLDRFAGDHAFVLLGRLLASGDVAARARSVAATIHGDGPTRAAAGIVDAAALALAGSRPSNGSQVPGVSRVSQTAPSLTVGVRQRC